MKNKNSNNKQLIKQLFKNYKKMDRGFIRKLESVGFHVERTSKHVKLYYNDKLFICPASASDYRGGRNLASIICNAI